MGEPQIPEELPIQPKESSPVTSEDMKRWQTLQGVEELGIGLSEKQTVEKEAIEARRQQELAKIRDPETFRMISNKPENDIKFLRMPFFQLKNMEPLSQRDIDNIAQSTWTHLSNQQEELLKFKGKGDVKKIMKLREKSNLGQLNQKEMNELRRLEEQARMERRKLLGFAIDGLLPILVAPPINRVTIIAMYKELASDKNKMQRIKELEAVIGSDTKEEQEKKTQVPGVKNIEDVTYEELRDQILPKVFQRTTEAIQRRIPDVRYRYLPNGFVGYLADFTKQIKPNYTDWEGAAVLIEETLSNLRLLYYYPDYTLRHGAVQEIVRTIESKGKSNAIPIMEKEISQEEVNRTKESLVRSIREADGLIDERVPPKEYRYLPHRLLSALERLTDGISQRNFQDRSTNIEGMLRYIRHMYIGLIPAK